MLFPLIFILPFIQWFIILWISSKKNKNVILGLLIVILFYIVIRIDGYNGQYVWVDIFIWTCLSVLLGLLIYKMFEGKTILKMFLLIFSIILIDFTLVVNGVVTVNNWMWDKSIESRLETDSGNIVVLQGCDAGGLKYTKYSLREELVWGIFFKEYDKFVDYHPLNSDCVISLNRNDMIGFKYNICKQAIEK